MTWLGATSRHSHSDSVRKASRAFKLTIFSVAVLTFWTVACSTPSEREGVTKVTSVSGSVVIRTLPSQGDGGDDLLIGGGSGLYIAPGGAQGLSTAERVDRSPVASQPGAIVPLIGEDRSGVLVHSGRGVRWYAATGETLERSKSLQTPWTRTLALEEADLDGDGRSEVVALGAIGDTVLAAELYPVSRQAADVIWFESGAGRFLRSQLLNVRGHTTGCDSLFVARYGAGGGHLGRLGCEAGADAILESLVSDVAPADIVTADFDGDGAGDVIWADLKGGLQWWRGGEEQEVVTLDGDFRAFHAAQALRAEGISDAGYAKVVAALPPAGELVDEAVLATLDYDGDGDTDLAAISPWKGELRLYPNLDQGSASGGSVVSGFEDVDDISVGEFDGTPGSDVAVAADGTVWLVSGRLLKRL